MTNDELRALANALEPMAKAPRFEDFDVPAFCAWVRACADAEPVARIYTDAEMVHRDERWGRVQWIEPESELAEGTLLYTHPAPAAPHHAMLDSHRRLVEQAIQSAEHPSGMSTHDGKARIDASILRRMLAIIDSLPAAPQAEPKHGINWQPIQTAPKDNKRPLLLAYFNHRRELVDVDFDGSWERESESWEMPQEYYFWESARGRIDEPTHWAYQPEGFTKLGGQQ